MVKYLKDFFGRSYEISTGFVAPVNSINTLKNKNAPGLALGFFLLVYIVFFTSY